MVLPAAGVAVMVKEVALPATGVALAVTDTLGAPGAATTTWMDAVAVTPPLAVAVADAVYVPAAAYTC